MPLRGFVCLLLAFAGSSHLGAQDDSRAGFRRYTVAQGLSQGTVSSILQDHQGFIWIGTMDGLNRFDGIDFRTFRHDRDNALSISDNWINFVTEDESGGLWIGTSGGLNEFDRTTESFRRYVVIGPDGKEHPAGPVARVVPISTEAGPRIFIPGRGYHAVAREEGKLIPLGIGGPREGWSYGRASSGTIAWRGGTISLVSRDARTITPLITLDTEGVSTVVEAGPAAPGNLIVATGEGLVVVDPVKTIVAKIPAFGAITDLVADGAGGFWIGTGDGLWRMQRDSASFRAAGDPGGWTVARAGLEGLGIQTICRDSAGTVWAGTIDGLYRQVTTPLSFTVYRHRPEDPNTLGSNFVMPIVQDRSGRIWFGTIDRGLSVLTTDGSGRPTFRNFLAGEPEAAGARGRNVRSLIQDGQGTVWVGTEAGLFAYDTALRPTWYPPGPGVDNTSGSWVGVSYETRTGELWGGSPPLTMTRIDRPPGRRASFTRYRLNIGPNGASADGVNAIDEASDGKLWIGTEAGLFRFDPVTGSSERFSRRDGGLSNDLVWAVYVERRAGGDVVWAGTSQGLNRFDPSSGGWERYYAQEGFPNDWVYGILSDSLGRLWLSTNRGISCFDDSKPEGRKFRNFNASDGIAGDECNRRGYARLANGDLVFSGTMGVTRFTPGRLTGNTNVPRVVLTSVTVGGKNLPPETPLSGLNTLRLGPGENDVSFQFAALDFANPQKNQYAYRLDGRDRDWSHIGNRRTVSFAGLEPGEYVLRIKGSNNDGVWNERGIAVTLNVEPPFWRSGWFLASAVAVLVVGVGGVFRMRELRAREIFLVRRKIARDLHDEIGSNLTGIAVSGSLLKDGGGLSADQEARISDMTSIAIKTSELMRDLIWVVKPESDRFEDFGFQLKDAANGILAGTECHFTVPGFPGAQSLNLEVKHNLYLIYKEIITNIARHAKAKVVTIGLEVAGGSIILSVADDGQGFDPGRQSQGMGLKNIAARAAAVGGTVEVRSNPGGPSRVTVSVPIT